MKRDGGKSSPSELPPSQPRSSSLLPPVDEDPRTKQTEPSHLSLRPELSHLSLPPPNFRFQLLPRLSSASREKTQGRFKYLPGQVRAFQMLAGGTSITPMFQADKAAFDEAEKKREEDAISKWPPLQPLYFI